jgi:CTP:molybdopterin cytidylyltransferase MocA
MGRPKLLLPWGATSVLGHLIAHWQNLGAEQIAVVCAAGDRAVPAELQRLNLLRVGQIPNPAPQRGMFSSIQCAARWKGWKEGLTHWAIVLGDQPHLSHETCRRLLEFSGGRPEAVCQPRQGGHRRHPVVLPKVVFNSLACSTAADLKGFLDRHESAFCESEDEGLALDIDRPEDYERAVRIYLGRE